MPNSRGNPTPEERDERFTIPLDPETALRGLLAVDPTQIEPGQRWVSRSDSDEVVVVVDVVVNQGDTWTVKNVSTKAAYTISTNELLASYALDS